MAVLDQLAEAQVHKGTCTQTQNSPHNMNWITVHDTVLLNDEKDETNGIHATVFIDSYVAIGWHAFRKSVQA